jgi:hypothetical protein
MKKNHIKKYAMKFFTSLLIMGQVFISAFMPIIANADIDHPQEVTIEYDPKQAYTVEGNFPDGTRFVSKTAPLFAVYDGKRVPVFCIEPGVPITNHSTPGYTANPLPNMSAKTQFTSVLWKYAGTDADTQIVTQLMMWREENGLIIDTIIRPDGTGVDFDPIRNKINKVVADYQKKPSFDKQTVKVKLGESVTLTDTNNVGLASFDRSVLNSAGIDYTVKGNTITITAKADSKNTGTLRVVKSLEVGTPVAYKKAGQQTVLAGAIEDPNGFQLNIEVEKTGDLEITKLDKDSGKPVPGTEFRVDYNGKSQTVKTNAQGKQLLKDIPAGAEPEVTEISVPAPYVLDKNNTKKVVIQAGKTATVEFKNQVATGKTTLTKQDATTKSTTPLNPTYPMAGAKYGLFKKDGTLLKEFTLDDKLVATMDNLDLGSYFWQETQAPVGYTIDTKKYPVELTYKNQDTAVVVADAKSSDQMIRMNLDGQKMIQNGTNEMFKNGIEFTMTNLRTDEKYPVTTATVDGKKGYFAFKDLFVDVYRLTETKGVEGYEDIEPVLIKPDYNKDTGKFTFQVIDEKSGNILNEEIISQEELAKGTNVDLGTYTLKDKVKPVEKEKVSISTNAHIGDGETNTFTWGEDIQLYDDSTVTHENIKEGTERGRETILVGVYKAKDGTISEKEVWTSGIVDYTVTDKEMTERVLADYDYKQDPRGTRYYFKENGYSKSPEGEYTKDAEHNPEGKDPKQDLTPTVEEPVVNIATQAHIGDGETNTFVWGEEQLLYDDTTITHENLDEGTERGYQVILVAIYTDHEGKESQKEVWKSGILDYQVPEKEFTDRVQAEYDYRQDPRGTRYFFKELGYRKTPSGDYVKDTEHNTDGKDPKQDLTPTVEEPEVGISTQAHTGDGKTNTFTWGKDVKLYDDAKMTHKNIDKGTKRGYEVILVAVYTDDKNKETQKDVWTSGITPYEVPDKVMTERVLADYDYKKDPKGTRYFFKEIGYKSTPEGEFEKDVEHNTDGKDPKQDILPTEVGISTQAHTGDGKTNTFTWGEDVKFYDDAHMTRTNIEKGTKRGYEVILVAVYTDAEKKETEKDVWTSGIKPYEVPDKDMTERVLADYDYKKDPKGTRYYFKEVGYKTTPEDEFEKDVDHNVDGKDKNQMITPIVKDAPVKKDKPVSLLPQTGDSITTVWVKVMGWLFMIAAILFFNRNWIMTRIRKINRTRKQ